MAISPIEKIAYIGLGSNLHSPAEQIKTARRTIKSVEGIKELSFSPLYVSSPMGPQDQPDYVNAVMSISTVWPPLKLLDHLQAIERAHGRIRNGQRWCARTLDLDILLYDEEVIDLPELKVPHPGIADRPFVLYPLNDCAPDIEIPGIGRVSDLLEHCPCGGIRRLAND